MQNGLAVNLLFYHTTPYHSYNPFLILPSIHRTQRNLRHLRDTPISKFLSPHAKICAICVLCESYSTIPHEGKIHEGVAKFRPQVLGEDGAMVNPAMSRP